MDTGKKDLSAVLPDGSEFEFWECDTQYERELYVACDDPAASDDNDGSITAPFKSINRAAAEAAPGTRVVIRGGIYRECITPARGGSDPAHMISFEAYPGEEVTVRASEKVTEFKESRGWKLEPVAEFSSGTKPAEPAADDHRKIWAHELDPDMFRGYNPFCAVNIIHDRLFIEYAKTDMTTYLNRRGYVYCDGAPLKQVALYHMLGEEDNTYWVESNGQTIHFRLKGDADPADHLIEISVREQCIAPKVPFLSYIRIKGLTCAHAANGGPVPQRGGYIGVSRASLDNRRLRRKSGQYRGDRYRKRMLASRYGRRTADRAFHNTRLHHQRCGSMRDRRTLCRAYADRG